MLKQTRINNVSEIGGYASIQIALYIYFHVKHKYKL